MKYPETATLVRQPNQESPVPSLPSARVGQLRSTLQPHARWRINAGGHDNELGWLGDATLVLGGDPAEVEHIFEAPRGIPYETFWTERRGEQMYTLAVPPTMLRGLVTLAFIESSIEQPRRFDISINGQLVQSQYCPFEAAGETPGRVALFYAEMTPWQGQVTVSLTGRDPFLNALMLDPANDQAPPASLRDLPSTATMDAIIRKVNVLLALERERIDP